MRGVPIGNAITLFQDSVTGRGATGYMAESRKIVRELCRLYGVKEIGSERIPQSESKYITAGDFQRDRPGFDLRVNAAWIDALPEAGKLAAISLLLVHEGSHSVLWSTGLSSLVDEVVAREIELSYWKELTGPGVLPEISEEPDEPMSAKRIVLAQYVFPQYQAQSKWFAKEQLLDYVLCECAYRGPQYLYPQWIYDHFNWWGGLRNRWATTLGYYLQVLIARWFEHTDLILRILEAVTKPEHRQEVLRVAGGSEKIRAALEPCDRYANRIAIQEKEWGIRFLE